MKAGLLEAVGRLKIIETDAPTLPNSTEVLIGVEATGICGSEVHAFRGTHPFRKPPSVMGHEVAGRIIEVGSAVGDIREGDRVVVEPHRTCGECHWCRTGQPQVCPARIMLGTTTWPGGFGQIITAPANCIHRLPDHLSYVQGTLAEPLAVGVRAVERAGLKAEESIAIIGTGPVGMMVAAAASARQASKIIVVDRQQHCLDVALHIGATDPLLVEEEVTIDIIRSLNDGGGVDVVFITVGLPALIQTAIRMVRPQGRIVLVALFDGPLHFEAFGIINPELTVIGTNGFSRHNFKTALQLISSGQTQFEAMVSHVLSLTHIQQGFELAESKADKAIKVVVEMGSECH